MPQVGKKKFPYTKKGKEDAKKEAMKSGKKMTKGYKAGGKLEMVEKDGKKVPFYAADGKGKMAEGGKVKKKAAKKKKEMKFSADDGGSISGPMNPKRKKVLDAIKANNSKPTPSMNNTSAPKPKTPAQAATPMPSPGAAAGGMAGGMGMPPKKPPMMKSGGKVKKYGHGGKVRGAGIAKKGVKKCKMR